MRERQASLPYDRQLAPLHRLIVAVKPANGAGQANPVIDNTDSTLGSSSMKLHER